MAVLFLGVLFDSSNFTAKRLLEIPVDNETGRTSRLESVDLSEDTSKNPLKVWTAYHYAYKNN